MHLNPKQDLNALFEAVSYDCDPKKVAILLDSGIDINSVTDSGFSVLMDICEPDRYGDYTTIEGIDRMVRFLIDRGANVSLIDSEGRSALDYLRCWTDPKWVNEAGESPASKISEEELGTLKSLAELLRS